MNPMDTRNAQSRLHALAQQLQGPLTAPALQEVLRALCVQFHEHGEAYGRLLADYARSTATITRLTETVRRLTLAVESLTAERQALAQAAADAYDAGVNAYLTYTNDYLEAHQDAWEASLRAHERLVIAPDALYAIDPRRPKTALRLCDACRDALGEKG